MKKYEKLELQVKEIQKEIERLKQEEKQNTLPRNFNRNQAIEFLDNFNPDNLIHSFSWASTPQDYDYWYIICGNLRKYKGHKVSQEAIIQIQKWIILSYQQEM
jgi:hypothetical protein